MAYLSPTAKTVIMISFTAVLLLMVMKGMYHGGKVMGDSALSKKAMSTEGLKSATTNGNKRQNAAQIRAKPGRRIAEGNVEIKQDRKAAQAKIKNAPWEKKKDNPEIKPGENKGGMAKNKNVPWEKKMDNPVIKPGENKVGMGKKKNAPVGIQSAEQASGKKWVERRKHRLGGTKEPGIDEVDKLFKRNATAIIARRIRERILSKKSAAQALDAVRKARLGSNSNKTSTQFKLDTSKGPQSKRWESSNKSPLTNATKSFNKNRRNQLKSVEKDKSSLALKDKKEPTKPFARNKGDSAPWARGQVQQRMNSTTDKLKKQNKNFTKEEKRIVPLNVKKQSKDTISQAKSERKDERIGGEKKNSKPWNDLKRDQKESGKAPADMKITKKDFSRQVSKENTSAVGTKDAPFQKSDRPSVESRVVPRQLPDPARRAERLRRITGTDADNNAKETSSYDK